MPHGQGRTHQIAGKPELIDLADRVLKRLKSGLIDQALCARIRSVVGSGSVHLAATKASVNTSDYDKKGVELWNATGRRPLEDESNVNKVLPLVRVLALELLSCAHHHDSRDLSRIVETTIRILRIALKTARTCISHSEYDLCTEVLQKAADNVAALSSGARRHAGNESDPRDEIAIELSADYWLLRATLSWKQARLDLAISHISNAQRLQSLPSTSFERLADLQHEIGKDVHKNDSAANAVVWYERAAEALDHIGDDQLSPEGPDLRASITRDLARALLAQKDERANSRAADLIAFLENEYGPKLGVQLLKFDLLALQDKKDPLDYQRILHQIIQSVPLNSNNFKVILLHIQKLHELDSTLSRDTISCILNVRLYEHGDPALIEKAAIMMTWSCSSKPLDQHGSSFLANSLSSIQSAAKGPFGDDCIHAAQTLLWKSIDTCMTAQDFGQAEKWCRLALHPIFTSSNETNTCKLGRKLMIICTAQREMAKAKDAYHRMPESGQQAPSSQYLLYKVALGTGDEDLAQQCLNRLISSTGSDPTLLYACVQEAQQNGSRPAALSALRSLLERSETAKMSVMNVPVLVRCMLQMLLQNLKGHIGEVQPQLDDICRLFTMASKMECLANPLAENHLELQWFAKTSYNVALHYMVETEDASVTLSLIDACLEFCKSLELVSAQDKAEIEHRRTLCHYISASCRIAQARANDQIESQAQSYSQVVKHARHFFTGIRQMSDRQISKDSDDLGAKRSRIIRYEIEALLRLKQWDQLDERLGDCTGLIDGHHLEVLADLIITVNEVMGETAVDVKYQQRIPQVMQAIINQSLRADPGDLSKLARWLRCTFRMTRDSSPQTALSIIENATGIVSRAELMPAARRYPPSEVEWLASMAYNTAVDHFCSADVDGSRMWAEAALNLARVATDSPGLYVQMQGLWLRLQQQMSAAEREL